MNLTVLTAEFTIHRLPPTASIPPAVFQSERYWIGRTEAELSIVCDAAIAIPHSVAQPGWAGLAVAGPIDFAVTGVLAGISHCLAAADISIFALSTFDTDYILVPQTQLEQAITALTQAGYSLFQASDLP